MRNDEFVVLLVTVPNLKTAKTMGTRLVGQKLAACVNIVPKISSIYWWEGKVETGQELLLVIKSKRSLIKKLEQAIHQFHPYQVPEFVVIPASYVARPYANWLRESLKPE